MGPDGDAAHHGATRFWCVYQASRLQFSLVRIIIPMRPRQPSYGRGAQFQLLRKRR
jgi:hypothetical protein